MAWRFNYAMKDISFPGILIYVWGLKMKLSSWPIPYECWDTCFKFLQFFVKAKLTSLNLIVFLWIYGLEGFIYIQEVTTDLYIPCIYNCAHIDIFNWKELLPSHFSLQGIKKQYTQVIQNHAIESLLRSCSPKKAEYALVTISEVDGPNIQCISSLHMLR